MSTPPMPDSADPSVRRRRPPHVDWKSKLRWFGAEYFVVVAGVLTAIALGAWWQGQQDRAQEASYLRQLAADLETTETLMASTDSLLAPNDRAGARLLHAYYLPERPPADSLYTWLALAYRLHSPSPVLGTVEALVATGDLALIRNDSLRTSITAYLDGIRQANASQQTFASEFTKTGALLYRQFDPTILFTESVPAAEIDSVARLDPLFYLPEGPRRPSKPLAPEAFFQNQEARSLLWEMNVAKRNMKGIRSGMAGASRQLREQVEAALDG